MFLCAHVRLVVCYVDMSVRVSTAQCVWEGGNRHPAQKATSRLPNPVLLYHYFSAEEVDNLEYPQIEEHAGDTTFTRAMSMATMASLMQDDEEIDMLEATLLTPKTSIFGLEISYPLRVCFGWVPDGGFHAGSAISPNSEVISSYASAPASCSCTPLSVPCVIPTRGLPPWCLMW